MRALPWSSVDGVLTTQPNAVVRRYFRAQSPKASANHRPWVSGRRLRVAALQQRPRGGTLAGGNLLDLRRGVTTVIFRHLRWGDRSGDAARCGQACDKRYEELVEHHCEE